jgi:cell division topological specificity factor
MEFFNRLIGRRKSAGNAKERLQLVLIHDRTDLTPTALGSMKDELIEVISRYVAIDPAAVSINITKDGRTQRLMADIPLRNSNRRRLK